jgi:hypothetical protein
MTTRLDKPIKRELELDGALYTVTISSEGVKIVEKGHRKGQMISWRALLSGDADLTQQLKLSVAAFDAEHHSR